MKKSKLTGRTAAAQAIGVPSGELKYRVVRDEKSFWGGRVVEIELEEPRKTATREAAAEPLKDEDEIAHWRRRVVESCIYGVDLNPLAVELAKLSLWLTTIATDQPLNFLDHHFCCGNSLIGARLEDLREVPELKKKKHDRLKLGWKGTENLRAALQKAVRFVEEIEEKESKNVDAVKNKEKLWSEKARPALEPFRAVANLWTSCFFGNRLPQLEYEALIELLDVQSGKPASWKSAAEFQEITSQAIQKGALRLAGRKFEETELATLCARLRHAGALATAESTPLLIILLGSRVSTSGVSAGVLKSSTSCTFATTRWWVASPHPSTSLLTAAISPA